MVVLLVLIVVVCIGLSIALVVGRLGDHVEGLAEPTSTLAHEPLPDWPVGSVGPEQVLALGFDRALRGYRMDQVDDVLDRLAEELAEREARIAALSAAAPNGGGWTSDGPAAPSGGGWTSDGPAAPSAGGWTSEAPAAPSAGARSAGQGADGD
ncbi:MAG TPA: DivIVA domain-containing protein [Dermatophilaceae bacterium]|nr:DivIVA domain-containing protein [Dermatophilaceae bacterium]